jgi:chromosome segregation ATPase
MDLEERVARIEGILEQMDRRIMGLRESFDRRLREFRDEFTRRLNHLETEMAELRAELGEMGRGLHSLFRWTIGLIIGVWATVITLMLPILLRLLGVI